MNDVLINCVIFFTEIRIGRNLRPRCNTERKLEKLKHDRSKQIDVQTISWKESHPSEETLEDLFPKKERQKSIKPKIHANKNESLLSQQIATVPAPIENPFADYSRCDATSDKPENSVSIRVFLTGKDNFKGILRILLYFHSSSARKKSF